MKMAPTVSAYISEQAVWKDALILLRDEVLQTELVETVKWGLPVYTIDGKNVVGLSAFKGYVGLWFFQGVFLKDPKKCLMNAQDGKTKGMRQMRFNALEDIDPKIIRTYLEEAIANQKAGKEIKPERSKTFEMPTELDEKFKSNASLLSSFQGLTFGKQKEYAAYISEAKQEKTRLSRLNKIIPMILKGVGLNDKYK